MIGETISHYRILSRIGQGGMGVVYLAEDTRLHRKVALKLPPADTLEDDVAGENRKERFLQEARAAARLHHPNICPIHEVNEADGRLFLTMAYLEGQTLSDLVKTRILDTNKALDLAIQIANGLEEARRQGVVHRDIKCSNIIVNPQGHAYILDFGLALVSGAPRHTASGGVVGTPVYMSPEQAQGMALDHRSDIWSLGVVLFEMLSGRRPFEREQNLQVLYSIVNDPPAKLSSYCPGLPDGLENAVEKALAKNPNGRWNTAGEFAEELRRIREGRKPAAEITQTILQKPEPPKRKMSGIAAAAAVVAVALGGGGLLWRSYSTPELPREKHLAVLPFEVIGGDETTRAIADGLTETLTSRLSEAEELTWKLMIVPASEIRLRKIASAGEALAIYGANLAVTGSLQRTKDRAELHLNLIDAITMRQSGARTIEFDISNPLGVRDQALNGLLSLLQVQFTKAAKPAETTNPAAYSDYLKGRGYLARHDVEGNIDRAIERFTAATQADEKFALAFSGLGESYWRKALITSEKQWAEKGLAAAQTAVNLDPQLAIAHSKLGDIYAQNGRPTDAIEELRTALRLDPGSADAHRALAGLYANLGRVEEAEKSYLEVTQRRPSDWYGFLGLGVFYWDQNRYADAEAAFEKARSLTPDNEIVYRNLAGLYVNEGRYADARREVQKALKLKPSARAYSLLGVAAYFDGRYEESATALEAAVDLDSTYYVGWGNLGSAYRQIPGAKEKARAALTRAVDLAQKSLEVTPDKYSIRANLAEYRAKLGESAKALEEIAKIPEAKRGEYWARIALAYELAGKRAEAVRTVSAALQKSALPSEVKDDPELAGLLSDAAVKRLITARAPAGK